MMKNSSAGVSQESSSSQISWRWAICGTGFGAGWSSHGMTSSPGWPGKACAAPATWMVVSPAKAAPAPFSRVRRDISWFAMLPPFRAHGHGTARAMTDAERDARSHRRARLRSTLPPPYGVVHLRVCSPTVRRKVQRGLALQRLADDRVLGGGRLVEAPHRRGIGRLAGDGGVLPRLAQDAGHHLGKGVERLARLGLGRLDEQRLVDQEREVDRRRVEAVV